MTCEVFLKAHMRNARRIFLLGSGRGIFGGLVDVI